MDDFYKTLGVPSPKQTPDERARTRLAFRNERNLYRRTCSGTGKNIISIFSEEKPFPVFCQDHWWSDKWDSIEYGRSFDFERSFFSQFKELFFSVPQLAINNSQSENCEFTNQSQNNKNCYLIVASNFSEDCYHGMWFQGCRDSLDCLYLEKSELCYEVISGKFCYRCAFCENITNCSDCWFCRDCIGCTHCVGSVNLRNASYVFFNERLSKEEYFTKIKSLQLDSYEKLRLVKSRSDEFLKKFPYKYYSGYSIEDSTGDYLQEVRNTHDSFNCRHCENVSYSRDAWRARNCVDLVETLENDYCLELEGCDNNVECAFSMKISKTHNTWYSAHCFASRDLFGCVGLRSKQYCIFNKQYTQSEYQSLRDKIRDHMMQTGEWGSYFPIWISPFGYNETVAHEYFPLSKADALKNGFKWKDPAENSLHNDSKHYKIPDKISEVADGILSAALICTGTNEPYRIVTEELKFYRTMNLPIPRHHPDLRHFNRMNRRNPRRLHDRPCASCETSLRSTFPSDDSRVIYCEPCYLKSLES